MLYIYIYVLFLIN